MPVLKISANEVSLTGSVGEPMFSDDDAFDAASVRQALGGMTGPVLCRLNSGGGSAMEGAAIHAVLADYPDDMTIVVEGVAASAASLLAMAATRIEMAPGAVMMIHDPAAITMGTEDDHLASAGVLRVLANEYASIYAKRAGMTPEDVREAMRKELWMGGDDAVAMGFADAVRGAGEDERQEPPPVAAFPYDKYAQAPEHLVKMARKNGWRADGPRAVRATRVAEKEEATMPAKETRTDRADDKTVNDVQKAVPKSDQIDVDAVKAEVAAAERERVAAIMSTGEALQIDKETIAMAISNGTDVSMFQSDAIKTVAKRSQAATARIGGAAVVTDDEDERKAEAMIGALQANMFGGALEGASTQYRGLTMKSLAMDLSGLSARTHTDMERVKSGMGARGVLMAGGMHSGSDFTYLTGELMNRQLRAAYQSREGTWRPISRPRTATDFRTLYSVQAGIDTEMRAVNEAGEYQATVLSDTGEAFAVERFGRQVLLTFEAVVNDDLGAFQRLPGEFARGARNLESKIVWGLINANGNMSDGVALYATSAARKNLAASGAAISATTVGAARKAMWEQRPQGAKATGADFISAVPDLLYVPPALEIAALQFAAVTTPETDGNTNPFKGTLSPTVEPRLGAAMTGGSDTAWYLFDSSLPVIEHALLQGYEAPMVESMDKMNPRGVEVVAEHIFGAGVVEFRGTFKNPG